MQTIFQHLEDLFTRHEETPEDIEAIYLLGEDDDTSLITDQDQIMEAISTTYAQQVPGNGDDDLPLFTIWTQTRIYFASYYTKDEWENSQGVRIQTLPRNPAQELVEN